MSQKSRAGEKLSGTVWFVGWLFTIGFLGLGFWSSVLGVVIWPYQIGKALSGI